MCRRPRRPPTPTPRLLSSHVISRRCNGNGSPMSENANDAGPAEPHRLSSRKRRHRKAQQEATGSMDEVPAVRRNVRGRRSATSSQPYEDSPVPQQAWIGLSELAAHGREVPASRQELASLALSVATAAAELHRMHDSSVAVPLAEGTRPLVEFKVKAVGKLRRPSVRRLPEPKHDSGNVSGHRDSGSGPPLSQQQHGDGTHFAARMSLTFASRRIPRPPKEADHRRNQALPPADVCRSALRCS